MFFRHRFLGLVAAGFLLLGLFGVVRSSAYRAGWAQGYNSGQAAVVQQQPAASEADGAQTAAPAASVREYEPRGYYGHYGYGFSPFGWFLGGLLKLLLIVMLFKFIFGFFFWGRRGWHRRHWHGHHGPPWRHGHHGHHGKHDGRSDKERYHDEHGPDSPIVDM